MAKSVFYSFDYSTDVNRVQLVRHIDALKGQPLLKGQDWEKVRKSGNAAIERWIAEQMKGKSAVIVLIGSGTAGRPWVRHEINKAWTDRVPLLGVKIHGLSSFGLTGRAGANPFSKKEIPVFDPTVRNASQRIDSTATYNKLVEQLPTWATKGAVRPR